MKPGSGGQANQIRVEPEYSLRTLQTHRDRPIALMPRAKGV